MDPVSKPRTSGRAGSGPPIRVTSGLHQEIYNWTAATGVGTHARCDPIYRTLTGQIDPPHHETWYAIATIPHFLACWEFASGHRQYIFDHFNARYPPAIRSRGLSDEDHDEQLAKAILNKVHGNEDTCHRCQSPMGVHLWGKSSKIHLQCFGCPLIRLSSQIGIF